MIKKVSKTSDDPQVPIMVEQMELMGYDTLINAEVAKSNFKEQYIASPENLHHRWNMEIMFTVLFASLAVVSLEFIDKDKR